MPLTKVTTAITAATPITTPSRVRTERSLFAHNDRKAILIASEIFMGQNRPQAIRIRSRARPTKFSHQIGGIQHLKANIKREPEAYSTRTLCGARAEI